MSKRTSTVTNSSKGPISRASLSHGLSLEFSVMGDLGPCSKCHWSVPSPSRFKSGDRTGKVARGERRQVVDAFSDADEVHGKRKFRRNGDEDAAARGAVKFGHDEAGDTSDLGKLLHLRQSVLPNRRVEHQQHAMRRRRIDLL